MNIEPAQTVGTVEMVSVTWLMQNLTHSVDGFNTYTPKGLSNSIDWISLVWNKSVDYRFGDLLATIMDTGFRVPIVVDLGYTEGEKTLGNGHHRISAAILLGLDQIPVYWSHGDYMSEHTSDTEDIPEHPMGDEVFEFTF